MIQSIKDELNTVHCLTGSCPVSLTPLLSTAHPLSVPYIHSGVGTNLWIMSLSSFSGQLHHPDPQKSLQMRGVSAS